MAGEIGVSGLATGRSDYYAVLTLGGLYLAGATPEAEDDDRWPLYAVALAESPAGSGTYAGDAPPGIADGLYAFQVFQVPYTDADPAPTDLPVTVPTAISFPASGSGGGSGPATATAYAIALSASSGLPGATLTVTVLPNAPFPGLILVTPSGGGLTDPIPFVFAGSATPQVATVAPAGSGSVTFVGSNAAGLIDPAPAVYAIVQSGGSGGDIPAEGHLGLALRPIWTLLLRYRPLPVPSDLPAAIQLRFASDPANAWIVGGITFGDAADDTPAPYVTFHYIAGDAAWTTGDFYAKGSTFQFNCFGRSADEAERVLEAVNAAFHQKMRILEFLAGSTVLTRQLSDTFDPSEYPDDAGNLLRRRHIDIRFVANRSLAS